MHPSRPLLLAAALALSAIACGPPVMNTPVDQIPKLTTLEEVMDNQATVADPQFKKIGESASYTEADFAAFQEMSTRLQATSLKTKDFSKGPEFDAFAMKIHDNAKALGDAAAAKKGPESDAALAEIKATCKACHSKFR